MQGSNDKVAFFDFCETLTNFQTADAFVNYVRYRKGNRRADRLEQVRRFLLRIRVISILSRILPKSSVHKRLVLYQLKGYKELVLEELADGYYNECVKPGFIQPIIERLKDLQERGYKVGLVSGGYDIYLKHFAKEFNLDFVISSRIEIKDGICTGKMDGRDCLDENKIVLINKTFKEKPSYCIAFSDSKTDLPMLQYARVGVVVSRKRHQGWIDNFNFEEIIWE